MSALAASHGHGLSPYESYLLFRWLWAHLRWWSLPVYAGVLAALTFARALLGGEEE